MMIREATINTCKQVSKTVGDKVSSKKRRPGVLPQAVITKLEAGVGCEPVRSMKVVRTPLEETAKKMLRLISLGMYDSALRDSPYDSMFHLSIFLNDRYALHKCEVVKFVEDNVNDTIVKPESEVVSVHLPDDGKERTIASLLIETRVLMGDEQFTQYDPRKNNCQDFILSLLRSCNALTPELEAFVKQDAEEIFQRLPLHAEAVAKFVTDGAAIGDRLWEDVRLMLDEGDSVALDEVRCLHRKCADKMSREKLNEASATLVELRSSLLSLNSIKRKKTNVEESTELTNIRNTAMTKVSDGVVFLRDMYGELSEQYLP